mgnify:CR=1 FL=1
MLSREKVEAVLFKMGMPANVKGFGYIVDCVLILEKDSKIKTTYLYFMVLVVIAKTLMFGDPVGGWPSLACIILFVGGIQLLCAGIVGKYLAKIYLEVKHRPLYLVAEDNLKDDLREKGEE